MSSKSFRNILGVIPARLHSTRLPGKVLAPVQGKPLVWWVWKRATRILPNVIVATDHLRVKRTLDSLGVAAVVTSTSCRSGTDRVAEVARRWRFPFYLNIQGDEPLIPPHTIRAVAELMMKRRRGLFTAASAINSRQSRNPHIVKVAQNAQGRALYFSRAPIPFSSSSRKNYLRHAGIYGYDRSTLLQFAQLPVSLLESRERLEQLRALENGIPIWMARAKKASPAVDTAADLKRVRRLFSKGVN